MSEELIEYNAMNAIIILLDHLISAPSLQLDLSSEVVSNESPHNDVSVSRFFSFLAMLNIKNSEFHCLHFVYYHYESSQDTRLIDNQYRSHL